MSGQPEQLTSVEGMTSEQIANAYEEGRLDAYLATHRSPLASTEGDRQRVTREVLAEMTPEQVADAYRHGALDGYLRARRR